MIATLTRTLIATLPRLGSPTARRLISGILWSLAGDIGSRVLTFLAALVVARWLGVAEFGAFALIQSTIATLAIFAGFGMAHAASRSVAAYRAREHERIAEVANLAFTFSAATGLAAALAFYAAAPSIAGTLLRRPELEGALRLVPPIVFCSALSGAATGTLVGLEAFESIARNVWVSSCVSFFAVVAGVALGGLHGALLGLVFSEAVRCVLVVGVTRRVLARQGLAFLSSSGIKEAPLIWEFGLPLLLNSLLFAPVIWICQSIIARQPDGLTQLGLFDAAQKWMTVVILAPMAAATAIGPVLAGLSGASDIEGQKRVTLKLAMAQLVLTAIPAALVALAAPWAMRPFGEEFAAGAPVVVLTMVLAPIFVVRHLYWQALVAGGRAWASLLVSATWAALAVGCTWYWRHAGAEGLARAMLVAYGLGLAAAMIVGAWGWRGKGMAEASDILVRLLGWRGALFHGDTSVHDRWRFLRQRLPRTRGTGERVLEVGCGTGAFTMGIASRGYEAVGLSWDQRNQAVAERRAKIAGVKNVSFPICDVRELDQRPGRGSTGPCRSGRGCG